MRIVGATILILEALTLLSALGCGGGQAGASLAANERRPVASPDTNNELPLPDPAQIDSRFAARLRTIAEQYFLEYKMVGDPEWAPTFCRAPLAKRALSQATSDTPHGRKIYYLWVKDIDAYDKVADQPQPTGQTIVKQSWLPVEVDAAAGALNEYVERDGKKYRPGRQADLFIMFKVEADANGTDRGWVYGTVSPNGQTVTSAGRVAACMACHQSAKPDRVFGAKSPAAGAGE